MPVGVVGAISPFNFPLNLVAHKVAPAIAAGCPIVLKPAGQTPLSAIALADLLLDDCGLPPEWLHVVTGSGGDVGDAIVTHDAIAYISFTGSAEVGWRIAAKAPRKKVRLELGNSTPVIIEADGDWSTAAQKIAVAGFSHAGQSCISTQRVYVHGDIAADFTAALVEQVECLKEGDRDRVKGWIDEAFGQGAHGLAGGRVVDGLLMPTVLSGIRSDMRVARDEVFGPVVGIQTYTSLDEALRLADDTRYGLQAGIFTARIATAIEAAKRLHFGGITVNEVPTWRADHMPYGGVRESGNTKEGPAWAVREMTEERLVVIQP